MVNFSELKVSINELKVSIEVTTLDGITNQKTQETKATAYVSKA